MEKRKVKNVRCSKCKEQFEVTENYIHNEYVSCSNCGGAIKNKHFIKKEITLGKGGNILAVAFVLLFVYIFWLIIKSNPNDNTNTNISLTSSNTNSIIYSDTVSDYKVNSEITVDGMEVDEARLNMELESFKKPFNRSAFSGSVDNLILELGIFYGWGKIIDAGMQSANPSIRSKSIELKKRAQILQRNEFPKMRRNYAIIAANEFSTIGTSIGLSGNKNTVISFTGESFYDREVISEVQTKMSAILKSFRFKQARYKMYRENSLYLYYDIESANDEAIVTEP